MSENGRPASSPEQLVGARLRLFARERTQIGDGQIERRGVECLLDRRAVDEDKPGAEDLVPVDDALERAPQRLLVQRRPNAHERRDVVGAEPRHDPVEQEQALLWEGEPARTGALVPDDRRRCHVLDRRRQLSAVLRPRRRVVEHGPMLVLPPR